MLMTKEHYDLMGQFEREHRGRRMDRESKESWPRGIIYQDGHVNELFAAYRRGYAFAVADYRSDLQNLEASRDGYRCDAERLQTEIDTLKASKAEHSEEGTPPASAQDDAKDEAPAAWLLTNTRLGRTWASIVSPFPGEIDELNSQGITAEPLYRRPATAAGDAPEDLLHRLANPLTPYGLLARALRVATGTTLMDMARATGNTAAEISSIEFGRKEPDEGWFERAALFFASTSYGIVVPPSALKAAHKRRAASQQQEG